MDTRLNPPTSENDESEYQKLLDTTARNAAYAVGPRVYHLTNIDPGPIRFFVLGCHGNGGRTQKETADLMNEIAEDAMDADEPVPAFTLFLGDNMYDYGVPSPSAAGFNDCFHTIYYNLKMKVVNTIPSFLLLGNHDDNMHGKAFLSSNASGDETGINQVAHTFIDNTPEKIHKNAALYKQSLLPVNKLAHWNMPYLYYSIVAGNTQIFCLNSNTYLQDYLDLVNGKVKDGVNINTGLVNQAWWFQKEYTAAKLAGRQVFIAQHHPLEVVGKRSFPTGFDYNHYLSWQQVVDLNARLKASNQAFVETASYNVLLASVFRQQGIHPDLVLAAHEHLISLHHELDPHSRQPKLRQFTAGGGGGDLQKRSSYRNHPAVRVLQEHNGLGMITVDPSLPNEYILDIYTTQGYHLRFKDSSPEPMMETNQDPRVEVLRECALSACDRYFNMLKQAELKAFPVENMLKEKPAKDAGMISYFFQKVSDVWQSAYDTTSHILGHVFHNKEAEKENRLIQDIQAYFSQHQLPEFQEVLQHLYSLTQQLPYRLSEEENIFFPLLQKNIKIQLGADLAILFKSAGLVQDSSSDSENAFAFKM